VVKPSFNT